MPSKENAFYFEGRIDKVENGWFSGWLWRSDLPNDPISVDLYVDNVHAQTMVASMYRTDLEAAGKGNGRHAFEIKLPGRCHDDQAHLIRLCYHGTVMDLDRSP